MNINKVLLAGLVGGVAYFFIGWLVWGILLGDTFAPSAEVQAAIGKPTEMWAMALSCLAFGFLLAYIFGRWAGISTFPTGATAGAIIGGLATTWVDFSIYAMYNISNLQAVIVDIILAAVVSAIIGGLVGWMLGRGK